MSRFASSDSHGALFDMEGEVSTGATWEEFWHFSQDIDELSWEFQLRKCDGSDSADYKFTTVDGDMTVINNDAGLPRILHIVVQPADMSGICGTYTSDLASKDADDNVKHWAHGRHTFLYNPVTF